MRLKLMVIACVISLSAMIFTACSSVANDAGNQTENVGASTENTNNNNNGNQQVGETGISKEEAEEIAFKHAGVNSSEITGLHTEYDIDDGIPEYDVDFYHESVEYEYEVNADDGTIITYETDK